MGMWFRVLLWATAVNYLAQIPYYFHQYYFRGYVAPNWWGVGLLALTLIWFYAGYIRYRESEPGGALVLGSYLAVQALFYLQSAVSSLWGAGMLAQLTNPSRFLKIIFGVGYLNGIVAMVCLYLLISHQLRKAQAPA